MVRDSSKWVAPYRYSLQALEEFKRANARGSTSEYERRPGPGRPANEKSGAAV
jgi:hypothetical protein